ncbi:hypothetical protein Ancab_033091 [Ancistrocladus abbreviatus]
MRVSQELAVMWLWSFEIAITCGNFEVCIPYEATAVCHQGLPREVFLFLLRELVLKAAKPDLSLYAGSYGGVRFFALSATMAIFDVVQLVRADVSTVALGIAASTASIILAVAKRANIRQCPAHRYCFINLLEVDKDIDRDRFMSSSEVVEYGIIDGVIDREHFSTCTSKDEEALGIPNRPARVALVVQTSNIELTAYIDTEGAQICLPSQNLGYAGAVSISFPPVAVKLVHTNGDPRCSRLEHAWLVFFQAHSSKSIKVVNGEWRYKFVGLWPNRSAQEAMRLEAQSV